MPDGGVNINAMPMYHVGGGAVTSFGTLAYRGTFVILPGFDPALMLEAFETYRGTHTLVVPTMLIALLEHPDREKRDLSSIQTIMSGASAVPATLIRRTVKTLGCGTTILFGQTEMHGVISQTRLTDSPEDQAETVGQPLPGLEVKVADPVTGEALPVGEQGEICCRGYRNMIEYYQMPNATREMIDSGNWLHMGDLGCMDERGFIKITGRLKDMIIRGGINIYPREIEELLQTHPAVAEVAVVGVPDQKWGEQLAAVIRLNPVDERPSAGELRAFCRAQMSAHKTPAYWSFVQAMPVTPTGKVQKFVLRDRLSAGALPPSSRPRKCSPRPVPDPMRPRCADEQGPSAERPGQGTIWSVHSHERPECCHSPSARSRKNSGSSCVSSPWPSSRRTTSSAPRARSSAGRCIVSWPSSASSASAFPRSTAGPGHLTR